MVPEDFEQWIAFIAAQLGTGASHASRAEGWVYLSDGDPPLVIVRLTPVSVTVWEYAAMRQWPRTPAAPIRIGSVMYRRLPEETASALIAALITAARDSRLAKFRECVVCGTTTAPEWLDEEDVCWKCTQTPVVH
jgi:hypothetical protein